MDSSASPDSQPWRRLLLVFAGSAVAAVVALAAFLLAFDPYGVTPIGRRAAPALMDLNQRFMYPQVIRTHRFDAAVFGTSSVRLLKPDTLDAGFEVRSANLAMNSATAWEQAQIAALFLRETPSAKLAVFGIDPLWCSPDAASPAKRLTFRAFPESFYDDDAWNDWPQLFNLKSIEIAWRLALHRLGGMQPRLPLNGYEVFTPDERAFDLARARGHIYGETGYDKAPPAGAPPAVVDRAAMEFPALAWLDDLLGRAPKSAVKIVVFPPAHAVGIYPAGSAEGERIVECKARIVALAQRREATVVDFRFANAFTRDDSNFWDHLHYRMPLADRLGRGVVEAQRSGREDPEGFYKVLTRSAPR